MKHLKFLYGKRLLSATSAAYGHTSSGARRGVFSLVIYFVN
jgi:hypothetical protein